MFTGFGVAAGAAGAAAAAGVNIFEEAKAKAYLKKLEATESQLIEDLKKSYEKLLTKMAKSWGSPKARDFFEKTYELKLQKMIAAIRKAFDNIADNFNQVAKKDAEQKGSIWQAVSLLVPGVSFPAASAFIQLKLAEGVGIKANEVPEILSSFEKDVNAGVEVAVKALKEAAKDTGLIGMNKARAFEEASDLLQSNITKGFANMIKDATEMIKKATDEESIEDDVVSLINGIKGISGYFDGI